MESELIDKIFSLTPEAFEATALEVFHFQYAANATYRQFVDALHINPNTVNALIRIPFLPVGFFKSHPVKTTAFVPELIFESSGTTQTLNSHHHVKDLSLYRQSFMRGFNLFYGDPSSWCIIALLPAYLERKNSSLIVMADALIRSSNHANSGFYLYDHEKLHLVLQQLETAQQKTLLIGVGFALLDFAEKFAMNLRHTIVMETGGMKGRREEMTRQEVHRYLMDRLGVSRVHSEYGMTELLSQAYSTGDGLFYCPPWMRVLVREEDDPLLVQAAGARMPVAGVINVADLANLYSCAFIATDDAGKLYADGGFDVLGRIDNSDIRGCSLMAVSGDV